MRFLLTVIFIIIALPSKAQMLPVDSLASDKNVARFYEGCLKIIEAENSADDIARNSAYAQAMDLLNTRSTYSSKGLVIGKMKAEITDASGLESELPKDFSYDYTYARSRYKAIDFAPKGVSRGLGFGCRVLDLVIKPGGTVKCKENVKGNCLLVALAQPNARIALNVTASDGREIPTTEYGNEMMGFAHWQNGESGAVEYIITNLSDKETLVTLFAN